MNKTSINWVRNPHPIAGTGYTWNPAIGCSPNKPSAGCDHCYAERLAATRLMKLPAYKGIARMVHHATGSGGHFEDVPRWSGEVRFFAEKLAEPLRRRTPSGVFVMDMGDIALLTNEQIAAIFGVMAACPQHIFYLLTKRPGRLREWFEWLAKQDKSPALHVAWELLAAERESVGDAGPIHCKYGPNQDAPWPLPNVWVGASVCTQEDADRNVTELLQIPAAVRFLSVEPLLEEINLASDAMPEWKPGSPEIEWVIVGGESGPRARPCNVEWVRSLVRQCRDAGSKVFVKQLGANIAGRDCEHGRAGETCRTIDRAGADPAEWPEDLRVREMPEVRR